MRTLVNVKSSEDLSRLLMGHASYDPIKTTRSLKTEPRIKREIGYIFCKVHIM